jgi:hypothetical protein
MVQLYAQDDSTGDRSRSTTPGKGFGRSGIAAWASELQRGEVQKHGIPENTGLRPNRDGSCNNGARAGGRMEPGSQEDARAKRTPVYRKTILRDEAPKMVHLS